VDIALCTRQTASPGSKQIVGEIVRNAFPVAQMKREASLGAPVSTTCDAFGGGLDDWFRICFAKSPEKLRLCLERLVQGLGELRIGGAPMHVAAGR